MEFIDTKKEILQKHCDKGQNVITELQNKAETFKMQSLASIELDLDTTTAYGALRKFLGDDFDSYYNGPEKPAFDEKKLQELDVLEKTFYKLAIKKQALDCDRLELYRNIKRLRIARETFSDKMFRWYKLNRQKTYRFDFATKKIFEGVVEIPKTNGEKPLAN
jgi:hypothetical protein